MNNNNINKEEKDNRKYYVAKSKSLAGSLEWITGQRPYVYKNKNNEYEFVYSFVYDDDLKGALAALHNARKQFRKENENK